MKMTTLHLCLTPPWRAWLRDSKRRKPRRKPRAGRCRSKREPGARRRTGGARRWLGKKRKRSERTWRCWPGGCKGSQTCRSTGHHHYGNKASVGTQDTGRERQSIRENENTKQNQCCRRLVNPQHWHSCLKSWKWKFVGVESLVGGGTVSWNCLSVMWPVLIWLGVLDFQRRKAKRLQRSIHQRHRLPLVTATSQSTTQTCSESAHDYTGRSHRTCCWKGWQRLHIPGGAQCGFLNKRRWNVSSRIAAFRWAAYYWTLAGMQYAVYAYRISCRLLLVILAWLHAVWYYIYVY